MNALKTINLLKSMLDAFEDIGDICDETEITKDDQLDAIRLRANSEMVELEELIVELEKTL